MSIMYLEEIIKILRFLNDMNRTQLELVNDLLEQVIKYECKDLVEIMEIAKKILEEERKWR